jgi:hypothetical protein
MRLAQSPGVRLRGERTPTTLTPKPNDRRTKFCRVEVTSGALRLTEAAGELRFSSDEKAPKSPIRL